MELLKEIITWASSLPLWQQVAMLKILSQESIDEETITELANLCIEEKHDLKSVVERIGDPLAEYKYDATDAANHDVVIEKITDTQNVNAIKDGSTLPFNTEGLTVVYGNNAVGKSGYTRIFKAACTCRDAELVLGNVNSEQVEEPSAVIKYISGGKPYEHKWSDEAKIDVALKTVHIFDSRAARVYLNEENDIQYVPAGLDIFDKLASVINRVKDKLGEQLDYLNQSNFDFETPFRPYENTEAYRVITDLSQDESRQRLQELMMVTVDDERKLTQLQKDIKSKEASSPIKRKEILTQRWRRYGQLNNSILSYKNKLTEKTISNLMIARKAMFDTAKIAEQAKKTSFDNIDFLPGTGGPFWKVLWKSAKEYSENTAYHGHNYPNTQDNAKCVLCQRALDEPSSQRLKSFDKFMSDKSQELANKAKQEYEALLVVFKEVSSLHDGVAENIIAELKTEDYKGADDLAALQVTLSKAHTGLLEKLSSDDPAVSAKLSVINHEPLNDFRVHITAIEKEAKEFDIIKFTAELNGLKKQAAEIEARKLLQDYKEYILKELGNIEKRKQINKAKTQTTSMSISKKGGELTQIYLVDSLKETFSTELQGIYRRGLKVELNKSKTKHGVTYSEITLSTATASAGNNLKPVDVMSESEQKVISLAGYFAELSLAPHKSAIVLDDPVTSLDHLNIERIAKRVVHEAGDRQVIVFTHNVVFVSALIDAANSAGIKHDARTVTKMVNPGGVEDGLPWIMKSVPSRIKWLRNKLPELKKLHEAEDNENYEQQVQLFYKKLREAWERAVEECLFANVVKRYSRDVSTKMLRDVYVVDTDAKTVADNMSRCSEFVHDTPEEVNDFVAPMPEEITVDLTALESWCSDIKARQNR